MTPRRCETRIDYPRIKAELRRCGILLRDFTEMIFMSYGGMMKQFAKGRTHIETARKIAEILNMPLEEILRDENSGTS